MGNQVTIRIRHFRAGDEAATSIIICRCLREVNSADYPPDVIEGLAASFTPEKVARFPEGRETFVAESGGAVVGTASLARDNSTPEEKYVCLTVFVLPEYHGRGVGKALISRVEQAARDKGATCLQVPSSVTALSFYAKLGYVPVSSSKPDPNEHWIWMTKSLSGPRDVASPTMKSHDP